ncbi:putative Transcriptional regulator, GntR family protein [Novosphingobium resinovorum]|uniref:Putative Transcriptional regulator, GntR family protein n=1 Tax=Novosphingobium resinovorum TaxID=158500 RepID=A0A031JSK6_9SPHN|nr:GntR family transcriptional regulator [Novosphingobium resinovorum]EZP79332.1 putative Transcriptional regulator, GntR family protein [Novosphingobium resinovorum]
MAKDESGGATRTQMIAAELIDEIVSGQHAVGARFPPELELRNRFGVGRHTIREALKLLTEQGLVGRRRKTGTFVLASSPVSPYVHSLRDLKGLLDFAETTKLQMTHVGGVSPDSKLLAGFDDIPDGRWLRVAGLRLVRGEGSPLCWAEILVPERFSPPRDQLLASSQPIYEEVMVHNSFRLEYVEQEVTASMLPPGMLKLFDIDGDAAALMVKRRYVAHTGETFEISHNLYPANRYRIRSIIRQRA